MMKLRKLLLNLEKGFERRVTSGEFWKNYMLLGALNNCNMAVLFRIQRT